MAGTGSVSASDSTSVYAVAVDADGNITVGGNVVELISTGAMGAHTYTNDGVLGVVAL